MELPLRIGPNASGGQIHCCAIKTIRHVQSKRSQRRYGRYPKSGGTEEPGRIDLPGRRPVVAGVGEHVEVEHLVETDADLPREGHEGVTERRWVGAVLVRIRVEPDRGNGKLGIPAELLAEHDAANRELLLEEERSRVAEQAAGTSREPHRKLDRLRARIRSTKLPQQGVRTHLGGHTLKIDRAA